jgi:hypothetical protein
LRRRRTLSTHNINQQSNKQSNKQTIKQTIKHDAKITLRSPSLPTNGATTSAALRVEKPGVRVATTLITAIISRYTWKFASFHPGDAYHHQQQHCSQQHSTDDVQ